MRGSVAKFVSGNRLVGWVWVNPKDNFIVQVYYDKKIIGIGIPNIDKPESESMKGLIRKGYSIVLTKKIDIHNASSDTFSVLLIVNDSERYTLSKDFYK